MVIGLVKKVKVGVGVIVVTVGGVAYVGDVGWFGGQVQDVVALSDLNKMIEWIKRSEWLWKIDRVKEC